MIHITARILLSAALLACLVVSGCENQVTADNFAKVKSGMSLSQVQKILGRGRDDTSHAGTSISSPGIAATSKTNDTVHLWDDGQGGTIQVIFQDDKAVQMTKTGLD